MGETMNYLTKEIFQTFESSSDLCQGDIRMPMKFLAKETSQTLENSREFYQGNDDPFPHIVIDNFLDEHVANECLKDFEKINKVDAGWIIYKHYNQNKRGNKEFVNHDSPLTKLTKYFNSSEFLVLLEKLSGYENIHADYTLDGAGLHEIKEGGYLNVHTDFQNHTKIPKYKRILNLILFFNVDAENLQNAGLELWDSECSKKIKCVEPIFNRGVIFSTLDPSYHGHPQPLITKPNGSRKSLALYYYAEVETGLPIQSTDYKSLPSDKLHKKFLVKLDNLAVYIYSELKRKKLISDELVTKFFNKFK